MEKKVFALADINNAYCSCERVFNPKLIGKPLIVLSNNDGCAISRSDEAKSIGIKMGVPLFKLKDLVKEHNVQVLSSNFPVYAEMSRRFMNVLAEFVGERETEVYSIDECFLDLTAYQKNFNLTDYARTMKDQVYQYLGLPICIGIGRTKTEAKLANFIAKKNKHYKGICNLLDIDLTNLEAIYQSIPVEEVWGIGAQHAKKLHAMGLNTVYDLAVHANPQHIQQLFSVVVKRTVLELQGTACIELEHTKPDQKQIICSRAFGRPVMNIDDLGEAISLYTQIAVRRLRKQGLLCGAITTFAHSNPFDENVKFFRSTAAVGLPVPTDSALILVKAAMHTVPKLFSEDIAFKKCGVLFTALEPKTGYIHDLLVDLDFIEQQEQLMATFDKITERFGKKKIGIGSCILPDRNWSMNQQYKTQNYFSFEGLPLINN